MFASSIGYEAHEHSENLVTATFPDGTSGIVYDMTIAKYKAKIAKAEKQKKESTLTHWTGTHNSGNKVRVANKPDRVPLVSIYDDVHQ
eukprot:14061978-Alexandrium_andersonii.AAC.1